MSLRGNRYEKTVFRNRCNHRINYISFGKDLSGEYVIETNMTKNSDGSYTADTSEEGTFVITYKITSGRCKGLTLYRAFTVVDGGDA